MVPYRLPTAVRLRGWVVIRITEMGVSNIIFRNPCEIMTPRLSALVLRLVFYCMGSDMMQKTFSLCLLGLFAAPVTSAEKPSNHPALMGTDTLGTPIPRD